MVPSSPDEGIFSVCCDLVFPTHAVQSCALSVHEIEKEMFMVASWAKMPWGWQICISTCFISGVRDIGQSLLFIGSLACRLSNSENLIFAYRATLREAKRTYEE